MNRSCIARCALVICMTLALARTHAAPNVTETARQIPVAASADVVIIGGGSGAIAAAVSAAKSGAKVYLVAPRPYLGEDIAGTMRLWLNADESPNTELANKLFVAEKFAPVEKGDMNFSYEASIPSAAVHKDTAPPSKLSDGMAGNAAKDSVQFDGDVTLTADVGGIKLVKLARVTLFTRTGDFEPQSLTVATSTDKKTWKEVGSFKCESSDGDRAIVSIPLNARVKFLRFDIKKAADSKRLLVGEIALYGNEPAKIAESNLGPFRPMHIKKSLDDALLAANVKYMYCSIVSDVLRDEQGNLAGVVIANRAGRQAIKAKVIIDATDRAFTARIAGAPFQPFTPGTQEFKFTTLAGSAKKGDTFTTNKTGLSFPIGGGGRPGKKDPKNSPPQMSAAELIEYTFKLPMPDSTYASFAAAEQAIRDAIYTNDLAFLTDEVFQIPSDPIKGAKSIPGEWPGADKIDLDAFKPAGTTRLHVLSGSADISREAAAKLVRPVNLIAVGERVGQAAAAEAKALPAPEKVAVAASPADAKTPAAVGELLTGMRPTAATESTVPSPQRSLPILGEYDVVVVGGGTGGAPAGISAARSKAKTLVIEYLKGLGGVGTTGSIATYYHGYRGGFTGTMPHGNSWDPVEKEEWLRTEIRKAGGDIWMGCIGSGVVVEDGKVKGIILTTPQGRGVVLAKQVIDATGNSDVAAAAGAQTIFHEPTEPAVQGTGLSPLHLGRYYINTDFTITDETDMMDVWHTLVYAKRKYANAFDQGQLIDTRERRRIVGEFTMTLADAVNLRTYPDTLHIARSDFDTHGFTVDPYLMVEHPQKKQITVNVPLRCLLPKGLENILVIGLGVSAHRDVMPLLRMQPDIQNQGYACGVLAATAARNNQTVRQVDLKPIQQQMVEMEIIPPTAIDAKDSYPLPDEQIAKAVETVKSEGRGMAVIITHQAKALPMIKQAFAAAQGADKLAYARILSFLGDGTGADVLLAAVEATAEWDKGWNYKAMGQFGHALSELDTLLIALGKTRDPRGVAAILKKVALLDASKEFSHHRAVALALEAIGDKAAANGIAELLAKPDMQGHVITSIDAISQRTGTNTNDNNTRATALRELSLARALYRCGDKDGLGKKILTQYTTDWRGHLATHAKSVLTAK